MTANTLILRGFLASALVSAPALTYARSFTSVFKPKERDARSEVVYLLKDFRAKAYDVESRSNTVAQNAENRYISWQSHAADLNAIREDINTMGHELARLEELRDSATPLERVAIDRSAPLLKEMASNTSDAIRFLNNSSQTLWQRGYRKDAEGLAEEGTKISTSVGEILKLAKVHEQEEHLEKAAGIESGSL